MQLGFEERKDRFCRNLNLLMEAYDLSLSDVSWITGLNYASVLTWVNGTNLPKIDRFKTIADAFGLTTAELVGNLPDNMTKLPPLFADHLISCDLSEREWQELLLFADFLVQRRGQKKIGPSRPQDD